MEALANPDADWMAAARCRTVGPEPFFVERGESVYEARMLCAPCPVRAECLEYAESNGIRHGIWGGLTPDQRRYKARTDLWGVSVETRRRIVWLIERDWKAEEVAREFGIHIRTVQRVLSDARERAS